MVSMSNFPSRETYLDIGAQDRNPYRACSSSNPTHHIGSLSYMCINLPEMPENAIPDPFVG